MKLDLGLNNIGKSTINPRQAKFDKPAPMSGQGPGGPQHQQIDFNPKPPAPSDPAVVGSHMHARK